MSDPFDFLLNLETTFEKEGFEKGKAEGQRQGLIEGHLLGYQKGFEIGAEACLFVVVDVTDS